MPFSREVNLTYIRRSEDVHVHFLVHDQFKPKPRGLRSNFHILFIIHYDKIV